VYLYPHAFNGHDHDDEVWEKLAQAIRNLDVLERFRICTRGRPRSRTHDYHEEEVAAPIPNWDRLARIISDTQQNIELDNSPWAAEEVQAFCRVIRGHPAITNFRGSISIPYESMGLLYSALATLPALRSVRLSNSERQARLEDESAMAHHESLTELLRRPSLRWVSFESTSLTPELCQATANAFMEGTATTMLKFRFCSFPDGECAAIMATGLSGNTVVSHIHVESPVDQTLYSALGTALPSNST
jgi:hypothetical protein